MLAGKPAGSQEKTPDASHLLLLLPLVGLRRLAVVVLALVGFAGRRRVRLPFLQELLGVPERQAARMGRYRFSYFASYITSRGPL